MRKILPFMTCAWMLVNPGIATAEDASPCLADMVIGSCKASATLENDLLVLESNAPSCSVIEWTLDGEPHVSVLEDERLSVEQAASFRNRRDMRRRVAIESCNEVADERPADHCSTLQAEHARLNANALPMDLTRPSAARQLESSQRRFDAFVQRFIRDAPVGCCLIGMPHTVCMTEHGLTPRASSESP